MQYLLMNLNELSPIEYWLKDDELKNIYTSNLWNDEEIERKKQWWILENDFNKLWKYLKSIKLYQDYIVSEKKIQNLIGNNSIIVDLAAGIGWTSALLSKMDKVDKVHCIEISKHRLDLLFPKAVEMFDGKPKKLKRYIGSFYSTKFENEIADVVFMSQAFHHANEPSKLLKESYRILKKDGVIIMIGEPAKNLFKIFKRFIDFIIKNKKITLNFKELFPPNETQGDHIHRLSDYYLMSKAEGFSCNTEKLPSGNYMFILKKNNFSSSQKNL